MPKTPRPKAQSLAQNFQFSQMVISFHMVVDYCNKKNSQVMQAGSRGWDADVDEAMGAVALGKKGEVEREMLNLGQVTSACAVVSTSILFFTNCHTTTTHDSDDSL